MAGKGHAYLVPAGDLGTRLGQQPQQQPQGN